MDNKLMHIMIPRPHSSRKEILQCNIDVIRFLKVYERLKLIRKEKLLYNNYIKKEMKELNGTMQRLFESLPEVKIEEREKRKEKLEKKEREIIEKPARSAELDKLEQDIKNLQEKINSL